MDLKNKVAIVTGSGSGIGEATALELSRHGCTCVLVGRTESRLAQVLDHVRNQAPHSIVAVCDVSNKTQVRQTVQSIYERYGHIDILVNNAGTILRQPAAEHSDEYWDEVIETNLNSQFLLSREIGKRMVERGRGLIVTIGSVADHQAFPGNAAYGAAKAGLRGLHGVLTAELAGSGVRATLISPGPVNTAIWDPVDPDSKPGFRRRERMLRPGDVAEAVLFVATRPEAVVIPELHIEPRA